MCRRFEPASVHCFLRSAIHAAPGGRSMKPWNVLIGFIGVALFVLAFLSRSDSFLFAGSVLIAGATIAAAIERRHVQ